MSIGYSDTGPEKEGCNGTFTTKIYTLTEAVVDYPISIVNNTVKLDSQTVDLHIFSKGNMSSDVLQGYSAGESITLGGFALAGTDLFAANVSVRFVGAASLWEVGGMNTFASQYIIDPSYYLNCGFRWREPTNDILNALHEVMFRTALKAANAADSAAIVDPQFSRIFETNYTLNATQVSTQNIFSSHFGYLAGALTVMTLGILAVLPTFYGWWDLGRSMTLSPVETAKAFHAPMLGSAPHLHSNATIKQLLKVAGNLEVK